MKIQNITQNNYTNKNTNFKAQRNFQLNINNLPSKNKTVINIIKLNPNNDKKFVTDLYSYTSILSNKKNLNPQNINFIQNIKNFAAEFITNANMQDKGLKIFDKDYYLGLINNIGMAFGYTLSNKTGSNPYQESRFSINSPNKNLQQAEIATTLLSVFNEYEKNNLPNAEFINFEIGPNHHPVFFNTKDIKEEKLNILQYNPHIEINDNEENIKDLKQYISTIQE